MDGNSIALRHAGRRSQTEGAARSDDHPDQGGLRSTITFRGQQHLGRSPLDRFAQRHLSSDLEHAAPQRYQLFAPTTQNVNMTATRRPYPPGSHKDRSYEWHCRLFFELLSIVDGPAKSVVAAAHHCIAQGDFKCATQPESPGSGSSGQQLSVYHSPTPSILLNLPQERFGRQPPGGC